MRIETDRKCRICGAHAPIMDDDEVFHCMTCQVRGGRADFPYIGGLPACPPAPSARNRMTAEEFDSLVASYWDDIVHDESGATLFYDLPTQQQDAIKRFALALINDAPN